jgi:hypothetical protein
MFEDIDGEVIVGFNCVADVPMESMHLLGGGVFKKLHTVLPYLATRVRVDITDTNSMETDITPDVEDRVKFLNKYKLREQARSLRYVLLELHVLQNY